MKPFKQSNSMKELLKKLRRHDTLVIGAGVMAATILCGAFVYVTTPAISADAAAEEVRKDSLGVQKKASDQLKEIDNYLERLDSVVTGSQDLIKEIQTVQNEQKLLTEKTVENEKNNSTSTNNTKVVEKISGLDKELASIHSEIKNTSDQVKELKDSMSKGGSDNKDKDKEDFSQITNALNDIKKACDKSSADVTALATQIKDNKESAGSDNKTVINNLEKIEKQLEKVNVTDTLSRMEADLLRTQNTYISKMSDLEKGVDKVEKSVSGVSKKVDSGMAEIDKNVSGVGNRINDVDSRVGGVDNKVSNIESRVGGVESKVDSVGSRIDGVSNKVDGVDNKINGVDSRIDGVGDKVDGVDSRIDGVGNKVDSVDSRISSVDSRIDGVDSRIDGVGTKVDTGFDTVKNGVDTLQQSQNNANGRLDSIDGRLESIEEDTDQIETDIRALSEKLNVVFNQVAGGKSNLASALATFGVYVSEDAKFSEFANAIKQLPEAILHSSNVEYKYHHHVDGKGACPHETSKNKGGCFQIEVKHIHVASCFKDKTTYIYQTNRYDSKEQDPASGRVMYRCEKCNKTFSNNPKHEEETLDHAEAVSRNTGGITTRVERQLVCQNDNRVEYYAPNCGYYENSIVEATIKYEKKNNIEASLAATNAGVNFIDGALLFEEFMPADGGDGQEFVDYPDPEMQIEEDEIDMNSEEEIETMEEETEEIENTEEEQIDNSVEVENDAFENSDDTAVPEAIPGV